MARSITPLHASGGMVVTLGLSRIDRYVMLRIGKLFVLIAFLLLLILSLERLLRLVDEVTAYGAPLGRALELLVYLQPHYLGLSIPAAFFLAVMLTIRRFQEQSEMVMFHAAGRSLMRMLWPIAVMATGLAILVFALVAYAQPYSRYAYRAAYHDLRENKANLKLRPGVFQKIGKNIVVRIEAIESEQPLVMHGMFVFATDRAKRRTLIAAKDASTVPGQTTIFPLILRHGTITREWPGGGVRMVRFDEYSWNPEIAQPKAYGLRGDDSRELTIGELWGSGSPHPDFSDTPAERRAEFHHRWVKVMSLPFLGLLAMGLGLMGDNRSGRAYGIGIGLCLLVLYEKLLGFGEALVADGTSPWLGLWGPWLLLGVGTALLLIRRNIYPHRLQLRRGHA